MNVDTCCTGSTCFIDTNIWLYSFIISQDEEKSRIAQKIIINSNVIISTQIINEIAVNLIKKANFSEVKIQQLITSFYRRYTVMELSQHVLFTASEIRDNYSFAYWDSLIAASALDCEADFLVSEDMQNGFSFDTGLTILKPFC